MSIVVQLPDISKSLKHFPIERHQKMYKKWDGTIPKMKRVRLKPSQVTYDHSVSNHAGQKKNGVLKQPRHLEDPTHVRDVADHLSINGFLPEYPPPICYPDPNNPNHYFGFVGFTRDKALKDYLKWGWFIYDVLEEEPTEIDIWVSKDSSNDHPPAKSHSERDIKINCLSAIERNLFNPDTNNITKFITRSCGKTKELPKIKELVKDVEKRIGTWSPHYITYHTDGDETIMFSTAKAAKEFGLPLGGDQRWNPNANYLGHDKLGFINLNSGANGMWFGAMELGMKYNWIKPIEFYFYVDTPKGDITNQRKAIIEKFNTKRNFLINFISSLYPKFDRDYIDSRFILGNDGYCFLPQVTQVSSSKYGLKVEQSLVNEFGKKI